MKLTTQLHLVPRLEMCEDIPLLHYNLMVQCLVKQWLQLYGMVLS